MTTQEFIDQLTSRGRVILLGGLAVIAHGLSRSTKDADIWLEPFESPTDWSLIVQKTLKSFEAATPYDLRGRCKIKPTNIESVVGRDGVIRISGLDRPLDIFRVPHNLDVSDFDVIWDRAQRSAGKTRIPDEIDLLITKEETSRPQDAADISFLENKIRSRLSSTLTSCTIEEATQILERYADHATCEAALANPDPRVRELALPILEEFAESGDPFASQILRDNAS